MLTKLNLGCGHKIWEGFINVDYPDNWSGKRPDVECDLRKLPFEDNSADEIHAIHVIEHFYRYEVESVLREWLRVLKPGGKLIIEVPCLDKILKEFKRPILDLRMTLWGLYGDPRYNNPHMVHKWAYCMEEMKAILTYLKLDKIEVLTPVYHKQERDMRVEAYKI